MPNPKNKKGITKNLIILVIVILILGMQRLLNTSNKTQIQPGNIIEYSSDSSYYITKDKFPQANWGLLSKIKSYSVIKEEKMAGTLYDTVSWVNIKEPNNDELVEPNEIIIPHQNAQLVIDYPLSVTLVFQIKTSNKGFTRSDIIDIIKRKYAFIYAEDRRGSKQIQNTLMGTGKFGINLHDISDLVIEYIEVYSFNGKIVVIPAIGS